MLTVPQPEFGSPESQALFDHILPPQSYQGTLVHEISSLSHQKLLLKLHFYFGIVEAGSEDLRSTRILAHIT